MVITHTVTGLNSRYDVGVNSPGTLIALREYIFLQWDSYNVIYFQFALSRGMVFSVQLFTDFFSIIQGDIIWTHTDRRVISVIIIINKIVKNIQPLNSSAFGKITSESSFQCSDDPLNYTCFGFT